MADGFFECAELSGKTIQTLRVYKNPDQANEVVIEFTDGTAFSCCLEAKCVASAVLFWPSNGTPEIIRNYCS